MNCPGNAGEKCGAGNRLSIYSNGTMVPYIAPSFQTTGLTPGWSFQGCLSDSTSKHSLPWQLNFPTNNSNTQCVAQCAKFGFNAAGTEYGVSLIRRLLFKISVLIDTHRVNATVVISLTPLMLAPSSWQTRLAV